jgi:hypothetical protein
MIRAGTGRGCGCSLGDVACLGWLERSGGRTQFLVTATHKAANAIV